MRKPLAMLAFMASRFSGINAVSNMLKHPARPVRAHCITSLAFPQIDNTTFYQKSQKYERQILTPFFHITNLSRTRMKCQSHNSAIFG